MIHFFFHIFLFFIFILLILIFFSFIILLLILCLLHFDLLLLRFQRSFSLHFMLPPLLISYTLDTLSQAGHLAFGYSIFSSGCPSLLLDSPDTSYRPGIFRIRVILHSSLLGSFLLLYISDSVQLPR